MVFNSENFSFSAPNQFFSLKNDSNSFSDLIKEDELVYEENIDDNYIGLSTELSSLSSITTTTSAYSSCSDSSNLASSCGRDSDEDSLETSDSNLFIQQILSYIDLHYNPKHKFISMQVSNCIDMKHSKKFWNIVFQKIYENDSKQDFFVNLSKYLLCLTTLESELIKHLNNSFIFEHEFVINLAYLLFEHSERLVNLRSISNLIFEIDLNFQSEASFEKFLNFLIQKYVDKFIPILINGQDFENLSGRLWIEHFKSLFEKEFIDSDSYAIGIESVHYENFLDTQMFLSTPNVTNEYIEFKDSNPISQGYKVLVNNLDRLQYVCNDPINDFEIDSEMYGRLSQDRSKLFSYFSASYYTMGLFDLKKSLFDNPLQYLYESKYLNQEHMKMFKNDSVFNEWKIKMIDSLKLTQEEFFNLFELNKPKKLSKLKKSKWDFEVKDLNFEDCVVKTEKSLYEEIIDRIQSLNTPVIFNNYFRTVEDNHDDCACNETSPNKDKKQEGSQSTRSWTVAPKLFAKNTTSNCLKRAHLPCSNCSSESPKRFEEYPESRNRSDQKPIGSKPASMFTISNSNSNRNRAMNSNKYVYVNPNLNKAKLITNTCILDKFKSVWKQDEDINGLMSPFVMYENFNLNDFSMPVISPHKTCSVNVDLDKRSNLCNKSTNELKNKKYSVAPIGLIGKKNVKYSTSKSPPSSDYGNFNGQKKRNVYSYERNYNSNQNYSNGGKNSRIRY